MNTRVLDIHERIAGIVARIESDSLRAAMSGVFKKLNESLDYLDLMEACVRSDETLPKSPLIIKLVGEKAESLITFIETEAKSVGGMTRSLLDILDSTTFALRHEIKRAYESPPSRGVASTSECRTQLSRAEGILRNCFQQLVVSLAVEFDSSVTGAELFGDLKLKQEQSVLLLEALRILKEQVSMVERERDLDSYFSVIEGLKMFEQGYMNYLMYKDWAEFEQFARKIAEAQTEAELWPLLHQSGRYLETLICHVEMRAVLNDHSFQQATVNN